MTRTEVAMLTQQTEALSKEITKVSALFNDKIKLLGINAVAEKTGPNNIPITNPIYFTFSEGKVPAEFTLFLQGYADRLIAERLAIWEQLKKADIKI